MWRLVFPGVRTVCGAFPSGLDESSGLCPPSMIVERRQIPQLIRSSRPMYLTQGRGLPAWSWEKNEALMLNEMALDLEPINRMHKAMHKHQTPFNRQQQIVYWQVAHTLLSAWILSHQRVCSHNRSRSQRTWHWCASTVLSQCGDPT